MTEVVITIFIFIGVIAITAVLFLAWLFFSIARFFIRSINGLSGQSPRRTRDVILQKRCRIDRCGAPNPIGARFCRRCGHELNLEQGRSFQRAAML